MRDERNVRHRRTAGGRWRPAAILLAAVIAAVSVPFFGKSVFAADPETCSLTVFTTQDMSEEDKKFLDEANVVLDFYRVADVTRDEHYDTFNWTPVTTLAEAGLTLPDDTDTAGWRETTQTVSEYILGKAPEGKTQWKPANTPSVQKFENINLGQKVELPAGIYFIVARGSNIEEYVSQNKLITADDEDNEEEPGSPSYMTNTVTLAKSSRRTYQFATELVMVPTKEPWNDVVNSGNPSEWDFDVEVYLKPAVLGVGGDLEIVKILDTYEYRKKTNEGKTRDIIDNATFVFEVTAYESYDEKGPVGQVVYHNYVSTTFKDSTSKTVLVKDIPVGSYVVVNEAYSGRSYAVVTDSTQTTVIRPDQAASVTFENEYDERHGGGGSVTNNFKFDADNWTVEQVTDSSTVGEHVSNPAENKIDKSGDSSK
ncbi:MAG: hypothetical protein IJH81_04625 [Lachnospiraceae bacterium]|nr:hypothetical protein [Lachnospiraceae bacterium]